MFESEVSTEYSYVVLDYIADSYYKIGYRAPDAETIQFRARLTDNETDTVKNILKNMEIKRNGN